nr:ABC transporter ATP-binding protein [Gemmatimonadota bacterium]NIR74419.1 ABC transporter ATP-binding protein [Candidatus Kutchimonas denitrificans]NIS00815.1 ABC transporter ATP-binding protein [Gemmatimonadota bacterium]NIT66438.1 ABC transporter ATP-binding protein [Gemmatimonadota bacterium]NIU52069.1 ABC transporter ATP-binding protein [Gemmatimonadota bacterium]
MVTHDPRYAHHAGRTVNLFDGQIVSESNGAQVKEKLEQLQESGFDT